MPCRRQTLEKLLAVMPKDSAASVFRLYTRAALSTHSRGILPNCSSFPYRPCGRAADQGINHAWQRQRHQLRGVIVNPHVVVVGDHDNPPAVGRRRLLEDSVHPAPTQRRLHRRLPTRLVRHGCVDVPGHLIRPIALPSLPNQAARLAEAIQARFGSRGKLD